MSSRRNGLCKSPEAVATKKTNAARKWWAESTAEKGPGVGRSEQEETYE